MNYGDIMSQAKLAFIGGGNLTSGIISGLVSSGYPPNLIYVADRNPQKCEKLKTLFGVCATGNVEEVIAHGDVLILSIKPQGFSDLVNNYGKNIKDKKPSLISVMAGINISTLKICFGGNFSIVRAMPNTASSVNAGATGLFANNNVSAGEKDIVEHIFRNLGVVAWVNKESHINAIIALAGSSPAYFLYLIEIMQDVGLEMGLDKKTVRLLTLQSAFGASKMGLQSSEDIVTLKDNITSKGGTTAEALKVFENNNLKSIVKEAMQAVFSRGEELENINQKKIEEKN